MFPVEKTSRRRTYKIYSSASPIFGLLIALAGVLTLVLLNVGAGVIMLLLGLGFAFACASEWVFDKTEGQVARALSIGRLTRSIWQRPLDQIDALEIKGLVTKDASGTALDDTRTALLFKSGERRSLWSERRDQSRELARFLSVKLVEDKAEN
ncbi:MAG TPA: hypothetical protein VHD90_12935 [Phototrophicaceae bacterium]|nr:hypothetical protein [Phototrophicaceae bacterium]